MESHPQALHQVLHTFHHQFALFHQIRICWLWKAFPKLFIKSFIHSKKASALRALSRLGLAWLACLALSLLVHSRNADGIEVLTFLVCVCKTSQSLCLPLLACLCSPLLACLCLPLLACLCLLAFACLTLPWLAFACLGLGLALPWLCLGFALACLCLPYRALACLCLPWACLCLPLLALACLGFACLALSLLAIALRNAFENQSLAFLFSALSFILFFLWVISTNSYYLCDIHDDACLPQALHQVLHTFQESFGFACLVLPWLGLACLAASAATLMMYFAHFFVRFVVASGHPSKYFAEVFAVLFHAHCSHAEVKQIKKNDIDLKFISIECVTRVATWV